jgi:hypothetical protein
LFLISYFYCKNETMKELISCCGINCENCEARIATLRDDNAMREEVAAKWSVMFHSPEITAQTIHCTGCRMEGVKFPHCENTCDIRKCVKSKGYGTCADCAEIDACQIVAPIFTAVPETRENLKSLPN